MKIANSLAKLNNHHSIYYLRMISPHRRSGIYDGIQLLHYLINKIMLLNLTVKRYHY